ncbi:MAG: hypothetical protein HXY18_12530 [Bryobacteraceae bacterium]|nr:hypothetical protein [Bryobacteraceae bacterium]
MGLRRSFGRWLFLRPEQFVLLGLDPPLQFGRVERGVQLLQSPRLEGSELARAKQPLEGRAGWLAAAMKTAAVAALCGERHRGLEEVLAQHQAGTEADEQGGLADMGLRHCR